jgi:4-amino-4-deoxy-L-arabinose transferase-like glycosyltransferase
MRWCVVCSGRRRRWWAAVLWLTAPFLMFFERTALMDAQTGALVVLAVWLSVETLRRNRPVLAVVAALASLAAILFKLTAAPVVATIGVILLLLSGARQRPRILLIYGVVMVVLLAGPLLGVLFLSARSSGGAGLGSFSLNLNLDRISGNSWAFADALLGFAAPLWTGALVIGLVLLVVYRRRNGPVLLLAALLLLLPVVLFSTNVFYRYFAVVMPLLALLAGAGLASLPLNARWRQVWLPGVVAGLLLGFVPYAHTTYSHIGQLTLPQFMRLQYITEHSSGFGLRAAARDLPNQISDQDVPRIASMFADSCRRANLYATLPLTCTDNLGVAEIEAALADGGRVYVLADRPPYNGIDLSRVEGKALRLAGYPRPGETEADASITLWLVESE